MRTIAILNFKGGEGKTVTAATMARSLTAHHGKSVLLIDADSQGSLSQYMGVSADDGNSTLTLLRDGAGYWPDFVTDLTPHLSIIPANIELAWAEMGKANVYGFEDLRKVLHEDAAYDYCIIDLPPSPGFAAKAALLAADEVIIPVSLNTFGTAGMKELLKQVSNMREVNPRLHVAGVLATKYMRTEEERAAHRFLKLESGLPVFRTAIRMSPKLVTSVNRHQSIFEVSPRCAAAVDYRRFVAEYLERGKEHV